MAAVQVQVGGDRGPDAGDVQLDVGAGVVAAHHTLPAFHQRPGFDVVLDDRPRFRGRPRAGDASGPTPSPAGSGRASPRHSSWSTAPGTAAPAPASRRPSSRRASRTRSRRPQAVRAERVAFGRRPAERRRHVAARCARRQVGHGQARRCRARGRCRRRSRNVRGPSMKRRTASAAGRTADPELEEDRARRAPQAGCPPWGAESPVAVTRSARRVEASRRCITVRARRRGCGARQRASSPRARSRGASLRGPVSVRPAVVCSSPGDVVGSGADDPCRRSEAGGCR